MREDASREAAIYNLFDRPGDQHHEDLEDELRGILQEKGLREADPYAEMLGRAQVAEIEGEASFEEVVREASERLSRALPADADHLTDTFLEETQLGVTPVSHGAALPHVRLDGVDIPHLLLVRSRSGLEIEDVKEPESTAYGQEEDTGEEQRDGSRVHAIFFLVSPEANPRQHLRMLARLADHVQDDEFLEDWLAAEGEHELREVMLRDERIVALHVERGRDTARLVDRPIGELDLPPEVIPTLIRRGEDVEVPTADTVLREGDCVTLFGTPAGIRTVRNRYRA
ncbi:MAG: PTS sugar transporter subunit IIA [Candidatus Palauibacterales bacterium]|nr:PTS sugar transporter subunit IIA [Candidatus Palauibacterales bacterium]